MGGYAGAAGRFPCRAAPRVPARTALGNDSTARQVTVLVTGALHRAYGLHGRPPKLSRPEPSTALTFPDPNEREQPLARPIANLRQHHTSHTKKGFTRPLIPPRSCAST